MTNETVVGIVVGATVGFVSAAVAYHTAHRVDEENRKEELNDAEVEGYKKGWEAASNNPNNIRKRYKALTNPGEGED